MNNQLTIFDTMYPKYKITKPIRLIELFGGYGSQALALKYLGINYEHWRLCEWAIKSIQAYKDIHFNGDHIDYFSSLPTNEVKRKLCNELVEKGKVKENDVIRHSYTTSRMSGDMKDLKQNNISPTLDTRCDCLGICVGTYQYAKSDNFMQGKDRLQLGKEVSDTLQTTQKEGIVNSELRIRKLTPRECFRLMGVKDEDFEKCAKNQNDSSLYHLAGDSIVVNVIEAIIKELL